MFPFNVSAQVQVPEKIDYQSYVGQVVFNTPGIPAYDDWEKYEKERIATEARRLAAARQRALSTSQKTSNGYNPCSCVEYARWKTGINVGPIGLARYHPINHTTPVVGAIGVMRSGASAAGHLFAVGAIEGDKMLINEANWSRCKVSSRWVPLSYGSGFYY